METEKLAGRVPPLSAVRQAILPDGKRIELMGDSYSEDDMGQPPRPVKLVRKGRREAIEKALDYFLDYRQRFPHREGVTTGLDLLYLLALAGTTFPAWWLRKYLSQQKGERSRLLNALLPGGAPVGRGAVDELLKRLVAELPDAIVAENGNTGAGFEIRIEATSALVKYHDRLELPDPAGVHAFWAFLWHDLVRNSKTPFWVRALSDHARRATLPKGLRTQLTESFIEACLFGIRQSLAMAFVDLLPGLIEQTDAVLDLGTDKQRRRFLRSAARAYALTADERILDVLTAARAAGSGTEIAARDRGFFDIFARSVGWADDPEELAERAAAAAAVGPEAVDYAVARGLWFLATLSWASGSHDVLRSFPDAVLHAHVTTTAVLQRALGRADAVRRSLEGQAGTELVDPVGDHLIIDLLAIATTLWTAVVLLHCDHPRRLSTPLFREDVLSSTESAALLASYLIDLMRQRSNDPSTVDFALEAMSRDLALTAAIATQALNDRDNSVAFESRRVQVERVLAPALGDPDTAGPSGSRQPALFMMHVAWRSLGFTHIADLLAIRASQGAIVIEKEASRSRPTRWDGVDAAMGIRLASANIGQ